MGALYDIPLRNPAGRLAGKVAMVVGAGAAAPGWGNGNATAALFAREGATVYCVDRSGAAAKATSDLIVQKGGTSAYGEADATSLADLQTVTDDCLRRFGRIDVLQNNVGGNTPNALAGVPDIDDAVWLQMLDLNLNTAFRACKAVIPHMLEQRNGAIVNIASVAAVTCLEDLSSAYSAAKAALLQMTRSIAMQYVGHGLRANSIIVGHIDTAEIRRRIVNRFGAERLDEVLEIRASVCRTPRNGTPWDIAYAALYLASDEASYVTGVDLAVDGGISIPMVQSYLNRVPAQAPST